MKRSIRQLGHPMRHARSYPAGAGAIPMVCTANMPMRLLLEGEFRDCGIRFPQHLLETTSAFATLALLQANPSFVALVSIEVAQFFAHQQMSCILPLARRREANPMSSSPARGCRSAGKLLIDELVHRRS